MVANLYKKCIIIFGIKCLIVGINVGILQICSNFQAAFKTFDFPPTGPSILETNIEAQL